MKADKSIQHSNGRRDLDRDAFAEVLRRMDKALDEFAARNKRIERLIIEAETAEKIASANRRWRR